MNNRLTEQRRDVTPIRQHFADGTNKSPPSSSASKQKPPKRRGFVLPILALLALIFAIFSVWRVRPIRTPSPPPQTPPTANLANAGADLKKAVAGVGLVEANTENIALSVPVPGWVTAVYAHAGDHVRTGERLFSLDDRDLQAELKVEKARLVQARANVQSAKASLADAELLYREAQRLDKSAVLSKEEVARKLIAYQKATADLQAAEAQVGLEESLIHQVEVNIERLTVTSPIDGQVLQSKVRLGQYAPTGLLDTPLMILGSIEPLNIRVDIDENDAWRVSPGVAARAFVRGNSNEEVDLTFVRFEPYVLPKQSLTGDSTERTDTRVLQAIYRVDSVGAPLFVGQQMDVFIQGKSL
jgi:RND family efflux transporter MFP subunit